MQRHDPLTGSLKALAGGTHLTRANWAAPEEPEACAPCTSEAFPSIPSPLAKLRVKPVMTNMVHLSAVIQSALPRYIH